MAQFARKTFQRGGFEGGVLAASVGMQSQTGNCMAGSMEKMSDGGSVSQALFSAQPKKLIPGVLATASDVLAYRSGKA